VILNLLPRAHKHHVQLGIINPNCPQCHFVDERPEWVKRAQERRLPVKDYSRS